MSNATNAEAKLGLIEETSFGETPVDPELISQRFATATFTEAREELLDSSKSDTRQYLYTQQGNSNITGEISGPFAHDNFDSLLESALHGVFDGTTDELIIGETLKSFTIEEAQPDISVYRVFKGCVVDGFSIQSPIQGLTTVTFNLLGLGQETGTTSVDFDDEYTAQPIREPFTHCGGTITEGGSAIGYVNSVSLDYSNNLETTHVWGDCDPDDLVPGRVDVTGSIDVFFRDLDMMNKFLNNDTSSLEFTLSDGTNTLTFNLPKIKYTGADAPVSDSAQRLVTMPFRALYDETADSTVVITRSV